MRLSQIRASVWLDRAGAGEVKPGKGKCMVGQGGGKPRPYISRFRI